jgi:hypothetical protein
MKFVLDESVPRRLAAELSRRGLDVSRFPNGWKGLKNGKLIAQILPTDFRGLITCDKNLTYQQNLRDVPLAIVVLPSPFFDDLEPRLDEIAKVVKLTQSSEHIVVGGVSRPRPKR